MTDQLLYRLNRVPERHYVKFLELIGVRLFPPTAAHTDVTFWLSAPQPETVRIAAGTQVATPRTQSEPAIVFSTTEELPIIAVARSAGWLELADGDQVRDHDDALALGNGFFCFDDRAQGRRRAARRASTEAVPSNARHAPLQLPHRGRGRRPRRSRRWRGRPGTATAWAACEVDCDTTGGLNRDGDVDRSTCPTATSASVIDGPARRLAPGARHRAGRGPAALQRLARDPRPQRLHRRRHGAAPSTPSWSPTRSLGRPRACPGGVRHASATARAALRDAARSSRSRSAEGWQEWREPEVAQLRGQRPRRSPLRARRGGRRDRSSARGAAAATAACASYGAVPAQGLGRPRARLPHGRRRRGNVARRTL